MAAGARPFSTAALAAPRLCATLCAIARLRHSDGCTVGFYAVVDSRVLSALDCRQDKCWNDLRRSWSSDGQTAYRRDMLFQRQSFRVLRQMYGSKTDTKLPSTPR